MPTLQLLTESQQKNFDSCPTLTMKQRFRYFAINEAIVEYLDQMRNSINQVGPLVQLAYHLVISQLKNIVSIIINIFGQNL